MTDDEQEELWLGGHSVHNPTRKECCPDFSCCRPNLKWPYDVRQRFVMGTEEERAELLSLALASLLSGENVYIVGPYREEMNDDNAAL